MKRTQLSKTDGKMIGKCCSYKNLFQIMQRNNIRNLNRVIFSQCKHLQSRLISTVPTSTVPTYFLSILIDTDLKQLNDIPLTIS